MNDKSAREFQIVLLGATGFTGQLTAEYLAAAKPAFPWALAGRNADKLKAVADALRRAHGTYVPTIVTDTSDPSSLEAMTARTAVVASTVGPYARLGEPVVAACVVGGADYVDITGEPDFVNGVLLRYDAKARERGVRLIPSCGFESIPEDLGVLFAVEKLRERFGSFSELKVEAIKDGRGQLSGGTWHSAVHGFGRARGAMRLTLGSEPPKDGRTIGSLPSRPRFEPVVSGYILPMPTIEPRIVKKTARESPSYGTSFHYGQYFRSGRLLQTAGTAAALGGVALAAQLSLGRKLLLKWKSPGDGPDAVTREKSHFRVTIIAEADGRRLLIRVSGGDPGYGETSKMLAEAAMALVLDRDRIPASSGYLTPALGFGHVLIDRLMRAGIRFEVLDT